MSRYSSSPLTPEQAATVYPLLREALPGLELRTWLRFAKRVTNPRRAGREGVIVVSRRERALPCGLFAYRREEDIARGPILVAEHLIAVDVLDPAPVMQALVAELEALARRLGCTAIRTMVMRPDSLVATGLHAAGHRPEGATLWKDVDTPGGPSPRSAC